jgi:hypothetical protein
MSRRFVFHIDLTVQVHHWTFGYKSCQGRLVGYIDQPGWVTIEAYSHTDDADNRTIPVNLLWYRREYARGNDYALVWFEDPHLIVFFTNPEDEAGAQGFQVEITKNDVEIFLALHQSVFN